MGPLNGPVFVFTVCLCLKTSFAYMEALAAHADTSMGKFEPEVAFICNKPTMHRVVNGWEPDYTTDCLENPDDILKYCKKIYPDHDVKNVIETTFKLEIPNWPKFDGALEPEVTGSHKVTPFKCLVGDFESEALLVPQHCVFDHEHDSSRCERPSNWTETASEECAGRDMILQSSGMLVVCGTDMFRGVEYVCCPKESTSVTPAPSWSSESESSDESGEEKDIYRQYLRGDEMKSYDNEHMKFKAAEKTMQKHQHEKVTKMMKEWQEAREHVSEMRKTDKKGAEQLNKEITERFQRMYHAFEQEGQSEKKQLDALHQQRVQAMFNKKKTILKTAYKDELESDNPKTSKILSYLKQYIRIEEKDRLHTVNHYEHVRDTEPEEAANIRVSIQKHLALITARIEETIDWLKRLPELEKKIRPEIDAFRHEKFRAIEISSSNDYLPLAKEEEAPIQAMPIDTVLQSDVHDYTNIVIDKEGLDATELNQAAPAHIQSSGLSHSQAKMSRVHQTSSYTNIAGIAIGSVAVFIIILVAVVMLRKRNRRQPITHGFVEVDPAASPEERHVANMQMNGYENPTYRYFEVSN